MTVQISLHRIFLTLIICAPLHAVEYVYPVVAMQRNNELKIYVEYQSSNEKGCELLLFEWDPATKIATPAVIPAYTPTDVKEMPLGISFIDKGKIFVKSFNKRSPKSILFYEPVDDIVSINWIDQDRFYFMGKQGDHYGIFHGTARGGLYPIIHNDQNDYLYPQKIEDQLFFIKRSAEQYTLMSCAYPAVSFDQSADAPAYNYQEQVDALLKQTRSAMAPLISEDKFHELMALPPHAAFLTMNSAQEGFMVSHPSEIETDQEMVSFGYWHLFINPDGSWDKEQLFEFVLPRSLIVPLSTGENENRSKNLLESLVPLLPRSLNGVIYYVDASQTRQLAIHPGPAEESLSIYRYDLKTHKRSPIAAQTISHEELSFAPLRVNEFIFYGGRIRSEDLGTGNSKPAAWINKDGLLCLDLPVVVDTSFKLEPN